MEIFGMSFTGDVVQISLNVYLFVILFVLSLIWKLVVGRVSGGRGGRY